MAYNDKFLKIYRGQIKGKKVTEQDVERVLEKLDIYTAMYKENQSTTAILRQSGLTEKELRDFVKNEKKHINRIKRLRKTCVESSSYPNDVILKELKRNKKLFLERLYLGDSITEAIRELWLPSRKKVYIEFVKGLEEEGYIVEGIEVIYDIKEDAESRGYTMEEIARKYNMYSKNVLEKNMKLHGITCRKPVGNGRLVIDY